MDHTVIKILYSLLNVSSNFFSFIIYRTFLEVMMARFGELAIELHHSMELANILDIVINRMSQKSTICRNRKSRYDLRKQSLVFEILALLVFRVPMVKTLYYDSILCNETLKAPLNQPKIKSKCFLCAAKAFGILLWNFLPVELETMSIFVGILSIVGKQSFCYVYNSRQS